MRGSRAAIALSVLHCSMYEMGTVYRHISDHLESYLAAVFTKSEGMTARSGSG